MKKILFFVLMFAFVGGGCLSNDSSIADSLQDTLEDGVVTSTGDPENVTDYFMTVSEEYLPIPVADRKDAITLVDDGNFYLEFNIGDKGDGSMAIFLTDDNEQEILFEFDKCGIECPQDAYVLSYFEGGWLDFTDIDIPELPNLETKLNELADSDGRTLEQVIDNMTFQVPHYKATVIVYDEVSENVLYELPWNGVTFDVEEVAIGDVRVELE